ncbi:DUF742 domain-containing protein [Plantactinospora sp. GCM10030261]|uniref:DUF742 domain-containing protein n=1 Tax=Plantactinospora sp. GCM10030261 TaxID=3273420 RepID=UPI0036115C2F
MAEPGDPMDQWVDEQAGPVVRPYAVTRGRARPAAGSFDMITLVVARQAVPPPDVGLGPEHLGIVGLCQRPLSVAEIAAHLNLPLGTIRVLLGDLVERDLIQVREPRASGALPDDSIFEAVINGLRAL